MYLFGALVKQSVLEECSYLRIWRDELVVGTNSQIGAGGSGEVLLGKLCKGTEVDVAVNDNYEVAQLVSPFMRNGNVTQYISQKNPGPAMRLKLVQGIAAGLAFLHKHQPPICHGDMKPANVLVSDSSEAALCDFGLASFVETSGAPSGLTTSRSIKGSARYMSPELLLETDLKHTLPSDMWAWACTIFEIVALRVPYSEANKESDIIIAVHRKEAPGDTQSMELGLPVAILGRINSVLISLVSQCWRFSPTERPTMKEVMGAVFSDEWEGQSLKRRVSLRISGWIVSKDYPFHTFSGYTVRAVGPWVCVKVNGVCRGTGCCGALRDETRKFSSEVDFGLDDSREVIVLEVGYYLGGSERTAGVVGIAVMELAREKWIGREHEYFIQDGMEKIIIEYTIIFRSGEHITDGHEQLQRPISVAVSNHGGRNFGATSSVGSEGTFYTARSHFSSYQMSIPGGYRWSNNSPYSRNREAWSNIEEDE
ncbi:hypothetical protein FS837_001191 [Tulasnella sp. UAMH 9824]|nr:hypothetical protein FS837_001191 [Tulasnella sp. UAMH 9824]